ncbi:MAG: SPFH domain-containing protein [Parcubacteria group bacterium]
MGGYVLWLVVNLLLIIGPFLFPSLLKFEMGGTTTIICLVIGGASLIVMALALVFTKLYHTPSASEALVRTGGRKEIIVTFNGGIMCVPVINKMQKVNLMTMRFEVVRKGIDALITDDKMRADIQAEFFIKVDANVKDIINAARSLGVKSIDSSSVEQFVSDKLVSALRSVATKSTLAQLNSERDVFKDAVMKTVKEDLLHNGLTLESVTISHLDQTEFDSLKKDNVFNAEGLRNAMQIIKKAEVETNDLQKEAELKIAQKNVAIRKQVLDTEFEQKQAESDQARSVKNAQAENERKAAEFKLQQDQVVAERGVEKDRAVEAAKIEAQKKLILTNQEKEVAEALRQQTVQTAQKAQEVAVIAADQKKKVAEVEREKAMEVTNREKEIAVKLKEKERADAEAAQLAAEVLKETQAQKVKTVEVVQQAEREKEQQVIKAKAEAETAYVGKQRAADAEAYQLKTVAAGKKEAADADAFAITRKAEAEKDASLMHAEGEKANKLVPVQVNEAQVAVDRKALEQKVQFGEAALKFELNKLEIEKTAQIRIESAKAMSTFMNNQKITVFTNSDMMNSMIEKYSNMMGVGQGIQGLYAGLSQDGGNGTEAKEAVDKLLGSGLGLVDSFGEFLKSKGKNFAPDQLKELFAEFAASQKQPVLPPVAPAKAAPEAPKS